MSSGFCKKKKALPRLLPEIQEEPLRCSVLSSQGKEWRRLAFLGDRTINFHITLALHEQCPGTTNAELFTKVSRLVSRDELSKIAQYIGLDSMITMKNTPLSKNTLGETMEAYIAGLCLEGKEKEIKNFANRMVKRYLLIESIENLEKELIVLTRNQEKEKMIEGQLKVSVETLKKEQLKTKEVKQPEKLLTKDHAKTPEKLLTKTPGKLLAKEKTKMPEKSLAKVQVNTSKKTLVKEQVKTLTLNQTGSTNEPKKSKKKKIKKSTDV